MTQELALCSKTGQALKKPSEPAQGRRSVHARVGHLSLQIGIRLRDVDRDAVMKMLVFKQLPYSIG